MIGIIVGIALEWYYFNYMENNTYMKNVIIYSVVSIAVSIISQALSGGGFQIIQTIIANIIVALIVIKIMEFAKARTNNLAMFILITELCVIAISWAIAFGISMILRIF